MTTADGSERSGAGDGDGDGFGALGLSDDLLATLDELGYEEPTPIQRSAIPVLLGGGDVVGAAATGTGKTAAFALPILQRLGEARRGHVDALVLVPTRELAMQVCEALYRYGRRRAARVVPVYGGQPIHRQLQALSGGVDVVVATPGRALDHLRRGSIDLSAVRTVVLDEADEMLDMGFAEDIESILTETPADRQTVLFSATMPARIAAIAAKHLTDPTEVRIERDVDHASAGNVTRLAYIVARAHKAAALGRILDVQAPESALVFCRTRTEVDQLTETLNGRGYRAEALHGGMDQEQRDRVMGRMRAGTAELLIATDVAARGLDIDHLTHVVNFDVPSSAEVYVHRIGRVGRAGRDGTAITLAEPREQRLLANLERASGKKIAIAKVPSVAELRTRQAELTEQAVRDALEAGDDESFAALVESLSATYDLADIAGAALALFHRAAGNVADEVEIPEPPSRRDDRRDDRRDERGGGRDRFRDRDREPRGREQRRDGSRDARGERRASLFLGLGKQAGVSPADIVGAIANETSLSGAQIGPIKIFPRNAVVGVPEDAVDEVIAALAATTVRGQKVNVRRYVEQVQRTERGARPPSARVRRSPEGAPGRRWQRRPDAR